MPSSVPFGSMNSPDLKSAALEYAARGFWVIPLWPGGKHPMRNFRSSEPSRDQAIIEYWWGICPTANIGLATGSQYNRLVVLDLDVDGHTNGIQTLKYLCARHRIALPDTAVARTGSGGCHIYFRNPEGRSITGCRSLFPGIDLRAEDAHVVAPPSIHENGCPYEWIHLNSSRIANCTLELLHLLSLGNRDHPDFAI